MPQPREFPEHPGWAGEEFFFRMGLIGSWQTQFYTIGLNERHVMPNLMSQQDKLSGAGKQLRYSIVINRG